MIAASELLLIKSRLLTAANAARAIATSSDPVLYDQEQYEAVYSALMSMGQDLGRILAELDILRGMFHSGVSLFLAEELGRGKGVSEPGGDVAGVSEPSPNGCGEGEPPVTPGVDGGVSQGRVPRKRTKRPKSRRNPSGDAQDQTDLGSADGAVQVDSSADA